MSGITLFKTSNRGTAPRIWSAVAIGTHYDVTHGIQGGKLQTETTHCIPKNTGRANATTAEEQAILEVVALYKKKLQRENYKYDLSDTDELIEPMLALDYSKVSHRVPTEGLLHLSPKLDGVRAIWIPGKGLQSRKGVFYNVPHIVAALQGCDVMLDGELYLHGEPLNRISGAVKKHNALTDLLEYHVFDMVSPEPNFVIRNFAYERAVIAINNPQVKCVEQVVRDKCFVKDTHDFYVNKGYEGVMIRVDGFPYEYKRSASLFKYKEFLESEFLITGIKLDKDGGAVLTCGSFDVRCRGTDEYRLFQANNPGLFIGKSLTVRYFSITEFNEPQFPVGIAVRDYE